MDVFTVNKVLPTLRFKLRGEEWFYKKIGDICIVKTGGKDTQDKKESGKYPFFVRSNTVEKIDSFSFDGEAILTSGDGVGVGKNFHYINDKFDYHQRVYALHTFKEGFSGKFIFQVFKQKFYRRVMRLSAKNSVDSVRMSMITDMEIAFPSLPEQKKIASFLIAVDEKLQLLTKKKELLSAYKKGVMQKIFSQDLRFKDEFGNNYPDWEEKKLGEVASKASSNISANKIEENFGDYNLYGASGILKKVDFYTEEDSYISIVKDGAGVGRILLCEPYSSVLGTLDKIKPKESNDLYFIYTLLQRIYFERYTVGSTIPHIYFKDYSLEKIKVPSLEEQKKIAKFLSSLDSKIDLVSTQIENSKAFKKGLLQQMFV